MIDLLDITQLDRRVIRKVRILDWSMTRLLSYPKPSAVMKAADSVVFIVDGQQHVAKGDGQGPWVLRIHATEAEIDAAHKKGHQLRADDRRLD